MAESQECFTIGSTISCKTCFNEEIKGEVLAFDHQVKILILKCAASNGRSSQCDIRMVNLTWVKDVEVLEEVTSSNLTSLPLLKLNKLKDRLDCNRDKRQKFVHALRSGVSVEARNLFLYFSKIYDDVTWRGANISVMDKILIVPPYTPNDVSVVKDAKDVKIEYFRRLVEKFYMNNSRWLMVVQLMKIQQQQLQQQNK